MKSTLKTLAVCTLGLVSIAAKAQTPPSPTVKVCYGTNTADVTLKSTAAKNDAVTFTPVGSLLLSQATGTLRLFKTTADKDLDFKNAKPELEIPFERSLQVTIASLTAAVKLSADSEHLILGLGDQSLRIKIGAAVPGVAPCMEAPPDTTETAVDRTRRLRELYEETAKLFAQPELRNEREYLENAVVRIDARTGQVQPGARIKIRRGHYIVVQVDNGYIVSLTHEQSMAEGYTVVEDFPKGRDAGFLLKSKQMTSTGYAERKRAVENVAGVTLKDLSATSLSQAQNAVLSKLQFAFTGKSPAPGDEEKAPDERIEQLRAVAEKSKDPVGNVALVEKARAISRIIPELPTRARNGWVRAAYRETVFRVTVIPDNAEGPLSADNKVARDVLFTVNGQKWGVGVGAGFVFAAPGDREYTYGPESNGKKTILEKTSSTATPFPTLLLNLWMWEMSQWGATLAIGVESEDQRVTYGAGLSYLFSGHAQLTVGAVLVPQKRLPSDYYVGKEVGAGDDKLLSLGTEQHVRFFVGLGWRFGSSTSGRKAGAETEPTP